MKLSVVATQFSEKKDERYRKLVKVRLHLILFNNCQIFRISRDAMLLYLALLHYILDVCIEFVRVIHFTRHNLTVNI